MRDHGLVGITWGVGTVIALLLTGEREDQSTRIVVEYIHSPILVSASRQPRITADVNGHRKVPRSRVIVDRLLVVDQVPDDNAPIMRRAREELLIRAQRYGPHPLLFDRRG